MTGRRFQSLYLMVYRGDAGFLLFEIAIWLQVIEDGWHEPGPVLTSTNLSTIGSQKASSAFLILANQDTKHLSYQDLFCPFRVFVQITAHLIGRFQTKWMRLVAERVIHPLWTWCMCM